MCITVKATKDELTMTVDILALAQAWRSGKFDPSVVAGSAEELGNGCSLEQRQADSEVLSPADYILKYFGVGGELPNEVALNDANKDADGDPFFIDLGVFRKAREEGLYEFKASKGRKTWRRVGA